jgi:hypothetical protein
MSFGDLPVVATRAPAILAVREELFRILAPCAINGVITADGWGRNYPDLDKDAR